MSTQLAENRIGDFSNNTCNALCGSGSLSYSSGMINYGSDLATNTFTINGTASTTISPSYYNYNGGWTTTWPTYSTNNITYVITYDPYKDTDMNCTLQQKDDRIILVISLAGFKKDEVKIKYFNPDEESTDKPYIEYIGESKSHALKNENSDTYKVNNKYYLNNVKKLNFATAKTSFSEGLVTIEVEYDETSKVKQLPLE